MPLWRWPPTMASTVPGGSAFATSKISPLRSHEDRSSCDANDLHEPPACAVATITVAPALRRRAASAASVAASGAIVRPLVLAGMVEASVSDVSRPTMPTRMPATSTTIEGLTLGQVTGRPVVSSMRFAARNGNRAWAARALSAPRGSSFGPFGVLPGPPDRSRTRDCRRPPRCSRLRSWRGHRGAPLAEVGHQRALEHVATVEEHDAAVVRRPRRPQVRDISRKKREPAAPLVREDSAVQVGGADDRQRDAVRKRPKARVLLEC